MFTAIASIIKWFGNALSVYFKINIPTGDGGYINFVSLLLFMFILSLSAVVISMVFKYRLSDDVYSNHMTGGRHRKEK